MYFTKSPVMPPTRIVAGDKCEAIVRNLGSERYGRHSIIPSISHPKLTNVGEVVETSFDVSIDTETCELAQSFVQTSTHVLCATGGLSGQRDVHDSQLPPGHPRKASAATANSENTKKMVAICREYDSRLK